MLKVLAACGNGMGASHIIKMKLTNVFARLKVPISVGHLLVGEAASQAADYDVIFCSQTLVGSFKPTPKTRVIGLKNLLSEQEIEQKIKATGLA